MGKGTGKGGNELCELFQGVALCACLILFAGPILIVIGGIFLNLGIQNFRQAHINSLNQDVNNFRSAVANFKNQHLTASFDGSTNCPKISPVVLQAQTQGKDFYPNNDQQAFNSYDTFYFQSELSTLTANQTNCTLKTTIKDHKGTQVTQFSFQVNQAVAQIPSSSLGCTTNSTTCFAQACQGYGGIISPDAQNCNVVNIAAICVRVKQGENGTYQETDTSPLNDVDSVGDGCFALETSQRQMTRVTVLPPCFEVNSTQAQQPVTSSGAPKLQVRHANDPYIAYQYISNGRCTFGDSRYRQFSIGVSCTVVGGLITCAWIVAVYFVISKLVGRRLKRTKTSQPLPLNGLPYMDPVKKPGFSTPSSTSNSHANMMQGFSTSSNQRIKHGQYPANLYYSSSQYSNDDKNSQYSNSKDYHPYRNGHSSGQTKNTTSGSQNSPIYSTNGGSRGSKYPNGSGNGNARQFSPNFTNQTSSQKFLQQFKSERSLDAGGGEIYSSSNNTNGKQEENQEYPKH